MGGQQQAFDLQDLAALVDRYALLVVAAGSAFEGLPGTEAVYCDSVDEAIVWLEGSRAWSAVVAGRSHPALEEAAVRRGVPVATLPAVDLPAFLRDRASPLRSAHDLGRCGASLGALCPVAPAAGLRARLERGDAGALWGPGAGAGRATVGGPSAPAGSGPAPPGSAGETEPAAPAGSPERGATAGPHHPAPPDGPTRTRATIGPEPTTPGATDEVGRTRPVPDAAMPVRGGLVAVCGPGGTGASTVAMAVAAGLARLGPGVVLADLALRAGQAVLHQVVATEAGLEALVHAHQIGRPTPEEAHRQTLPLDGSAYHLLIGLRRPSLWTAIRPLAFDATLQSLRALFSVVVADITGDLEGEAATGSVDLGERNHMARRSTATADVVVVVGADGPTARRALDATIDAVQEHRGHPSGIVRVRNGLWEAGDPHESRGRRDPRRPVPGGG